MAGICRNCGKMTKGTSQFCPGCGSPVQLEAGKPIEHDPSPTLSKARLRNGGIAVGAALVLALILGVAIWTLSADADSPAPEAAATEAAADPDAPRPQEWFDTYVDRFLSAEIERLVVAPAQKRSFPTARGSEVTGRIEPGEMMTGRWVEGADPATRWLKIRDGSYVWEGNLAEPQTITAFGMNGFRAGDAFQSISDAFRPQGNYGSQSADWDTYACETYSSNDRLVDVMVIEGKAGSFLTVSPALKTANGIHVGSTEKALLAAYGSGKLKREANPYDGVDYFFWAGKDRGIKFHVAQGKVETITAGDRSIEYVEGCL